MRDYGQDLSREQPIVPREVTWEEIEQAFPGAMAHDLGHFEPSRPYILPEECYPEITLADLLGDFCKLAAMTILAVGIPLALYLA